MIEVTCPSPCNTRYSFTEQDKRWATLNTYCPKCKSSLAVQRLQKEFNDKKSRGEPLFGWKVDKKGVWLS